MITFEITVQRKTGTTWPIVVEQSAEGVFLPAKHAGRDNGVALARSHHNALPLPPRGDRFAKPEFAANSEFEGGRVLGFVRFSPFVGA